MYGLPRVCVTRQASGWPQKRDWSQRPLNICKHWSRVRRIGGGSSRNHNDVKGAAIEATFALTRSFSKREWNYLEESPDEVVTGDELRRFDRETWRQIAVRVEWDSPKAKKEFRFQKSRVKMVKVAFYDVKTLNHKERISIWQSITVEAYTGAL